MSTIRLVVVDDDPVVRMAVRLAVESDGRFALVGEASDAPTAMDLVREQRPEAVVLDHMLVPGGPSPHGRREEPSTGLSAVEYLRAIAPATVVAIYSGKSGLEVSARNAGADLYVEKGRPEDLLDALAAAVSTAAGH